MNPEQSAGQPSIDFTASMISDSTVPVPDQCGPIQLDPSEQQIKFVLGEAARRELFYRVAPWSRSCANKRLSPYCLTVSQIACCTCTPPTLTLIW